MNEKLCRSVVLARSGGRCERCNGIGKSYHHRKKRSQGGEWSAENVVLLCGDGTRGCHGWVEHNPNAAEAEGLHVRPWESSDAVPVKYRRTEWVVLLPDGDVMDSEAREEEEEPPE